MLIIQVRLSCLLSMPSRPILDQRFDQRANVALQPQRLAVGFQVEAPVARRSPHRPGREDFPHPVPRF